MIQYDGMYDKIFAMGDEEEMQGLKFTHRYLLFNFSDSCPSGAFRDVVFEFDEFEEKADESYINLLDFENREIIYRDKDKIDLEKVREIINYNRLLVELAEAHKKFATRCPHCGK